MRAVVAEACASGALGFSTSNAPTHNDGDGEPVPSRGRRARRARGAGRGRGPHAGHHARVHPRRLHQRVHRRRHPPVARMSVAAGHPINWNVLGVTARRNHEHQLAASDAVAERGGRVVALTLPHSMRIRLSFLSGFILDGLPGGGGAGLPVAERLRLLADPEVRHRLAAGAPPTRPGSSGRRRLVPPHDRRGFPDETRASRAARSADRATNAGTTRSMCSSTSWSPTSSGPDSAGVAGARRRLAAPGRRVA